MYGYMGSVLVEVDATVGKLSEGSLLLDLGGLGGVLFDGKQVISIHPSLQFRGRIRSFKILTYSSAMFAVGWLSKGG
jgi:hypothetical protein